MARSALSYAQRLFIAVTFMRNACPAVRYRSRSCKSRIEVARWGPRGGTLDRALACLALLSFCLLASCVWLVPRPAGIGEPVDWSKLPGWQHDRHAEAWTALLRGCEQVQRRDQVWNEICGDAALLPNPDDATARAFFEAHFIAHKIHPDGAKPNGLITGYYEPLLYASLKKTARFRYPLYGRPPDLLTVDLADVYPELRGKPVRGRAQGSRVVPYFSRSEIDNGKSPLRGQELAWVDDPVDLFFLHIQGSGRLRLPDGRALPVGYADQNGHPYEAIGRRLIQTGALKAEEVTLESIKGWLQANPNAVDDVLNSNPSYVFFDVRDENLDGPLGSLGVALTAGRSIAVDTRYISLGSPVWLDTTLPGAGGEYQRLVFAQDTGGAIKGAVRADVYFGHGDGAEKLAGEMKQAGRLYVLRPLQPVDLQFASGGGVEAKSSSQPDKRVRGYSSSSPSDTVVESSN